MAGSLRLLVSAALAALLGTAACAPAPFGNASGSGSGGASAGGAASNTGSGTNTGSNSGGAGGGSSSTGFNTTATSSSTGCVGEVTCAGMGLNCGTIGDGCGSTLDCGDKCANADEVCGGAGKPNVCGVPPCTAKTCAQQGIDCGPAGDGCGKQLNCGTTCPIAGDTCGGGGPGKCGHTSTCVPETCLEQAVNCGPVADGCGDILPCGNCPAGSTCGGGGIPSVCGAPPCTAKSCTDLGIDCGAAADGCGGIVQCGSCVGPEICGGLQANQCGTPASCTGLCKQQVGCPTPGVTTTLTGTVYAPNGTDPLPNAVVYVPNAPVLDFTAGVTCDNCGTTVSGAPLVSYVTGIDGKFTLTNVPMGSNIPLVIQLGRWRRQVVITSVPMCQTTAVDASLTNLPQNQAQGDIPLMAFSTGAVDALECVLRKIGVDDTEFTAPGGGGRINLYQGLDDNTVTDGALGGATTVPSVTEDQLWGTQAALNQYDMIFFPCQQNETDLRTPAEQQRLIDYANAGGRVFATHFSYIWLYNDAPFSGTVQWKVEQHPSPLDQTGFINTAPSFPKGQALAQWLVEVAASSTYGQIPLVELRHDNNNVVAPTQSWVTINDVNFPDAIVDFTFNTPVGTAAAQQCGRVLFDDFHVENVGNSDGMIFPDECVDGPMSAQEKLLEYMIFDLGACISSDTPPACKPKTCAEQGINCGAAGDGCGAEIMCPACAAGQTCGGGGTPSVCGTPKCAAETCASQNLHCGFAGDGCGNQIDCGACPLGQSCGGGGMPGVCGTQPCSPKTCMEEGIDCGPAGNGCGGVLQCGTCMGSQTCGGGGTPGMCGTPSCVPKTCAELGFNCGPASNGCGTIIQCGNCELPQTCGATSPNVCGGGGVPS